MADVAAPDWSKFYRLYGIADPDLVPYYPEGAEIIAASLAEIGIDVTDERQLYALMTGIMVARSSVTSADDLVVKVMLHEWVQPYIDRALTDEVNR